MIPAQTPDTASSRIHVTEANKARHTETQQVDHPGSYLVKISGNNLRDLLSVVLDWCNGHESLVHPHTFQVDLHNHNSEYEYDEPGIYSCTFWFDHQEDLPDGTKETDVPPIA